MAYNPIKVSKRQVLKQTQQTGQLGIVSEVPMGDWNATIPYKKLNKVRYVSAGGSGVTLLAKKANQGVEPFVSNGWQEVWMVENYDGGAVSPDGIYPDMTVGNATNAQNDSTGNNIANQFSEVVLDIQGLREDINTESHFRGMFESIEALRVAYPTATPNDYAYIVGGNIYIWQNNTWQDSGEPSPNTAIPKGTSTPLMDGVGSAGVANAYAPIDHRHPENTNKVSKSGDTMTGALELPSINIIGDEKSNIYKKPLAPAALSGQLGVSDISTIKSSLTFDWYNTRYNIGNVRGGSVDSDGFGIVYNDNNLLCRVTPTGDLIVKSALYENDQRVYSPNNKPTAADLNVVPRDSTARGQVPVSTLTTGGGSTWVFPMAEVSSASTAVGGRLFTSYNLINGNNCAIQTKIKNNYKLAIQWGRVDSSGSSATFASVTFPRSFWDTPKVFATYQATNTGAIADSYGWVRRDSVSTTGCSIRSYGGNSIVWIAIGVVSGD